MKQCEDNFETFDDNQNEKEILDEGETIEQAFTQMEILYRSRCVQSPTGQNVIVREIKIDD